MTNRYPTPQHLLQQYGFSAKKSWGQHFLMDERVLADMVRAIPTAQPVIELGAGLGALTAPMLDAGLTVIAVERDPDMQHVLAQRFGSLPNFTLVNADAGHMNYAVLAQQHGLQTPISVVGNLPYNIGSRIAVDMAHARGLVGFGLLMLQREVIQRMVATSHDDAYGLLSLLMQRTFDASILRNVPPGSFHPPPQVHSAVVKLVARPSALSDVADAALVKMAKMAFQHRRKTLRVSLKSYPEALDALRSLDLSDSLRPEDVLMAQWERWALRLAEHTAP